MIDCTFAGRMNGCVWFGHGPEGHGVSRRNIIGGNDFTAAQITANVGWRVGFPTSAQAWPPQYVPAVDG
jgi:hypothetical protein